MLRRTFLTTTKIGLVGVLVERLPPDQSTLDPTGEPLDEIAKAVKELRYLDYRDGSLSVLVPATWLAERLTRLLAGTPVPGDDRGLVASLTADAAELAGWASAEIGEHRASLGWYARAIQAASQAGNPDFATFSRIERARVLWRVGEDETALQMLGQVKRHPAPADLQVLTHALMARLHAGRGEERATHQAIEAAMTDLASVSESKDSAWSAVTGLNSIENAQGAAMLDLGYFDRADDILSDVVLQIPPHMRRRRGTVHGYVAEAALRNGHPERAAFHATQAHILLAPMGSRQRMAGVKSVMRELRQGYGDTRFVKEMDERIHTDSRYVLCRTSESPNKFRSHERTCRYANRGWARPWPAAERLDAAAARQLSAQSGYQTCERCMKG